LKLNQLDPPGPILLGDNGLQCDCRIPVTTPGVVEQNLYFFHGAAFSHDPTNPPQEHSTCHVENRKTLLCSMSSKVIFTHISRPLHGLFISPT
jgi:hypothetical protein